jgi:Ion transport protein
MFPYNSMFFHMETLKKAGTTFLKLLVAFFILLLAFVLVFIIVFPFTIARLENEAKANETTTTVITNETISEAIINGSLVNVTTFTTIKIETTKPEEADIDFYKNFMSLSSTVLKVQLMLSGEYSIEPSQLIIYEIVIFSIFVILTYILFNLIIGFTFDDVQKMRQDVRKIVMKHQIDKLNKTNKIYYQFYKDNK